MAKTAMKLRERMERQTEATAPSVVTPAPSRHTSTQGVTVAAARIGKRATVGHFSVEMHKTIDILRAEQGTTIQAMMGEAWDLYLVSKGKEPFGER